MKRILLLLSVVGMLLFGGCADDDSDRTLEVEVTISEELGFGSNVLSDLFTDALLFSDSDNPNERLLLDIITEGTDIYANYERGYRYVYKAQKVWLKNPPQDVSSIKYIFKELISEEQIITEDGEECYEIIVAPEKIRFLPRFPFVIDEDGSATVFDALSVERVDDETRFAIIEIENFDFTEGTEYQLEIKEYTTVAPFSKRYVLSQIISQTPAE